MKIVLAILVLSLMGCSAEAIRQGNKPDLAPMSREAERSHILEEGTDFCKKYPDDVACKGPKK